MNGIEGHSRHRDCHYSIIICSNNVSLVDRFRGITTFTVYVTACDLGKSFSFNKTVEITGPMRSRIHAKHII